MTTRLFGASAVLDFVRALNFRPHTRPRSATILALEGVVPTFEKMPGGVVLTHEGELSEMWVDGRRSARPSDQVGLQPAPANQKQMNGDDVFLMVWTDADGTQHFGAARGKLNADFSRNAKGSAQLADGAHLFWPSFFGRDPNRPPVFRPKPGSARVLRDVNRDATVTLDELVQRGIEFSNLSVLIHQMGVSEGCVGPLRGPGWQTLHRIGNLHVASTGAGLELFVWHGADFLRFLDEGRPDAFIPWLRPGCNGDWVGYLQEGLNRRGSGNAVAIDQIFGPKTARTLLDFRQRAGVQSTWPGVDRMTWRALRGF
ncbi:MAG: hypothetical protein AAFV53_23255 [Myxococcota bacterium]